MTKKILLVVLASAVMSVAPALAAGPLAEASASAQAAARGSRAASSRAAAVAAISRLIGIYKGEGGRSAFPTRCLGERNLPIYHREVANLAIAALRVEQGYYPDAAGLEAVEEQLEFPASKLLEFGRSKCMEFSDERTRAAWIGALEELRRLN